jgi:hypothetical protein
MSSIGMHLICKKCMKECGCEKYRENNVTARIAIKGVALKIALTDVLESVSTNDATVRNACALHLKTCVFIQMCIRGWQLKTCLQRMNQNMWLVEMHVNVWLYGMHLKVGIVGIHHLPIHLMM